MSQIISLATSGGGGTITSVLGTANEIDADTLGTVVTLSIPSPFIAPGSIQATTTVTGVSLITSLATKHLTITDNTITAGGSDATVDISLTTKSTGNLNITTATGGAIIFRGLTSGFTSTEELTKQASVQTTNATTTNIVSIVVNDSEMVSIMALINGFQSDFTDCVGGSIMMTAFRPAGGNITLVGAPIINVNYTDLIDTSDISASINVGTQSAQLQVIGVAAQTWNWVTTYRYMYTISNA